MEPFSTSSNMTLNVTVAGDFPLPKGVTRDSLHSLIHFALEAGGAAGDWEIGMIFISDEVIQDMHRDFMGLDSPTDILTFPYQPFGWLGQEAVGSGGDMVISMETASVNAADAGWRLRDELEFLALHGVLHILGWVDTDPEARAAMLARQSELLDGWRARA